MLSRRDWVYSLSLLIPFAVYSLALKASTVLSLPGDQGFARILELIRSDVFFGLGYALLWVGLLVAARGGFAGRIVVFLFHAVTILVVLLTTCAHQYLKETGTTLDYGIIALLAPKPAQILPFFQGVSLSAWALLFAALFYATLGPWLVTSALERWRGSPGMPPEERRGASSLGFFVLFLLTLGLLSLLIGTSPASASISIARQPVVNVVMTALEDSGSEEDVGQPVENPAAHASLQETPQTRERNVVLIHLESTRAESTTPYNEQLETTPFLKELAKSSLLAERAYTTVPHTSKAVTSVNCGIFPHLVSPTTEALPDGIPAPCLATLLKEQGYDTVFFQSSTKSFEDFQGLVRNFGYDEYYPLESMDAKGFEKTNYFGYEDDMMLEPSKEWLKEHENNPFIAEYLLGTGHHDYQCLNTRYGEEVFSNEEPLNSYLNCMRLQDYFVWSLIDQYKELGLYNKTIFVIYGDHGEGFGEHGRYGHNDTIYEEGLKVPLIIHAPGLLDEGEQIEELSNLTDVLPTVVDLLGYGVKNGQYPGYSLLRSLPQDRTLRFSCWNEDTCLASIKGNEKYVYHYGDRPDEIFDLSTDPLEEHNLANQYAKEEVDQRRDDLLQWRSGVEAEYVGR